MTEEGARDWLSTHFDVSRETWARLEAFAALLLSENRRQNLIAASTEKAIWARHIADSAQLAQLCDQRECRWLDLGSGPGLPGLIVAILTEHQVTLVESRRRRADFLDQAVDHLGLRTRVRVSPARLEVVPSEPMEVISARAFAPLARLLSLAARFAQPDTLWLLPKGRSAASELAEAAGAWQGSFSMVPSVTDPEASIILAHGVRQICGANAKGKR